MNYAQHSGRVGALAVALGLGFGVMWSPGVAIADSSEGSTSSPGGSDAGTGSADASSTAGTGEAGTTTVRDDRDESTSSDTPSDNEVHATSPAATNGDDADSPDPVAEDDDDEAPTEPATGGEAEETPAPPPVETTPNTPPPSTSQPEHHAPAATPKDDTTAAVTAAPHHSAEPTAPLPDPQREEQPATPAPVDERSEEGDAVPASVRGDVAAASRRASLVVDTVQPLATPSPNPLFVVLATPVRIVTAVVGALLSPFLAPVTPATPAPPTLWAVLAWARTELQRTFFNRSPRLAAAPTDVEQVDDVVTGTLAGVDPDGDPVSYSVTPTTAKGGTVTVDAAGHFTYVAPATWNGVDPLTDSFTVSAVDQGFHFHGLRGLLFGTGHSTTREVTVQLTGAVAAVGDTTVVAVPPDWKSPRTRVGPGGTVAVTQTSGTGTASDPIVTKILVQGPDRPPVVTTAPGIVIGGGPLIADDGTVHLTTIVPAADGSVAQTTVTTLQPGQSAVSWTTSARPVGGPELTRDGTYVLTTTAAGNATEDPRTTVVVISDGHARDALTFAGATETPATIGADGTIALAVTGADGITTLGIVRPGAAAQYQELSGVPQGAAAVTDDGTVVITTVGAAGFAAAAAPTPTTVWVWRPGESAAPITVGGTVGQVVTGGHGTVAYVTTTGTGADTDPVRTTVTVLRPGTPDQVSTVSGTLVNSVVVGADGTVAFNTYAGNPQLSPMTVTVLRPDGTTQTATYTTRWAFRIAPKVGADGTVAAMWGNDDGMTLAVFRAGEDPVIATTPLYVTVAPEAGADGTVAFTVGGTTPTGENYSQVIVSRPGQPTRYAGTTGYGVWNTVADDGSVVSVTRINGTNSYLTVLRPDGDAVYTPVPGSVGVPPQVATNGVVYLVTNVANGVNVTIVHPSNRYVTLNLPGNGAGFSIGRDGYTSEFVTATIDASGAVVLTLRQVFTATVAPAAVSTLV